jgi:hypothetical protein
VVAVARRSRFRLNTREVSIVKLMCCCGVEQLSKSRIVASGKGSKNPSAVAVDYHRQLVFRSTSSLG